VALDPEVESITLEHIAILDERIERMRILRAAAVDPQTRAGVERVLEVFAETKRVLVELLSGG
jgi:hypothetical protein